MRLKPLLLSLSALALLPVVAEAANAPRCFNRAVERLDHVTHPPEGGDNAFFTRSGGAPPAGFLLFAQTRQMFELPGFDPGALPASERGCANSAFLNSRTWVAPNPLFTYSQTTAAAVNCKTVAVPPAASGQTYQESFVYPRVDDGCYLGKSYKTSDNFQPESYYVHGTWNQNGATSHQTSSNACSALPLLEQSACHSCLANDKKPYYVSQAGGSRQVVYKGNFLHFYGPIFLNAYAAWKTALSTNAKIRWGHAYYGENNFPGLTKGRDPNPECNKFDKDFNPANRGSYINSLSNSPFNFAIEKTSLAEGMFAVGNFFTDNSRFSELDGTEWDAKSGNQDTVCSPCQYSALIVLTDGTSNHDTSLPAAIPSGDKSVFKDTRNVGLTCSSNADCGRSLVCAGGNPFLLIPDRCISPVGRSCSGNSPCPQGYSCNGGVCGDSWRAADVAKYFYENDLRDDSCGSAQSNPAPGQSCEPEQQEMATYVINVGYKDNAALNHVAKQGGTEKAYNAATANELRNAFRDITNAILKRATSFSVAAITTVQTRGTTFAFIPRFRPSVQIRWEGHLYRYKLFNEFAAGCTKSDTEAPMTAAKLTRNPNGDGDCDDVFLRDKNGSFIGENKDGEFMVLDETTWTLTDVPGVPVWDGAEELANRDLNGDPRKIYTVIDADLNGVFDPDEQIEFNVANVAALAPYLGLTGTSDTVCTTLAAAISPPKVYADVEACAADLIEFIRGKDMLDDDEDGILDEPVSRRILGDIFHSSPVLVTPPAPKFLCDLGVANQCLYSLYEPKLTPGGDLAYKTWADSMADRDHFILVGANDGMVHAFHAGTRQTGDDPDTPLVEAAGTPYFDLGTGRELWGFIPPDLLPKLKRRVAGVTRQAVDGAGSPVVDSAGNPVMETVSRHEFFVDGTAMVRDVWVDSDTNPGQKDASEYHTMAVFGERQGGRSWFGIDVTDPHNPQWRWGWPLPGSTHMLNAGESWNDFAPNAPPIVPVAVADTNGPLTVNGKKAAERYVVFVNGGYDYALVRGRGISVLDVWTGQSLWRFSRQDATGSSDPRHKLFPVAGPVAVMDLGPGPNFIGQQDGLFDTAVFGDLAGQLWTARFYDPGLGTGDNFTNWHGARAFVQFDGDPVAKRNPFFQLPSTTVVTSSGQVRAYIGSGDRANIRDEGGGECGPNNLIGCVRRGCSVSVSQTAQDVGPVYSRGSWSINGSTYTQTFTTDSAGIGSACGDTAQSSFTLNINCGTANAFSYGATCDFMSSVECNPDVPKPENVRVETTAATQNARFYAVNLFGSGARAIYTNATQAAAYDAAALTDSDLVDVEADDTTLANSTSNGFYVPYAQTAERTASGTGLLAGCVIWNTLEASQSASTCGGAGGDKARLYRAHYVTGSTQCGNLPTESLPPRFVERTSIVPPPPPTPVVALNATTGEVRYSMISIEPGAPPSQLSVGAGDLTGLIYWLEVPRQDHECRHGGNCD